MLPSASQLDRVLNCPASHALPQARTQSDAAEFGTAVHAFLQRAHAAGRDEALASIPEDAAWRQLCEQLPLDELPAGGRREVSFAWDYTTGKARVLGTDRDYSTVTATEYCGTADAVGSLNGEGVVIDWKSGRYVGPPATSGQLLLLSLALSYTLDVTDVRASFVYLKDDGTFIRDEATLDGFDLAAFALKLQALPAKIEAARAIIVEGRHPDVSNGPWCRFCPASPSCPAKMALARSFGGELVSIRDRVTALLPDEAGRVYAKALEYQALVEQVIAGLKDVARVTPLELPDGRMLQETSIRIPTKVDAGVAESVILEMYGDEAARQAVVTEKSTTLSAIEEMLRKRSKAGTLAKAKRDTLDAIRARGGLREGSAIQVRAVKKGA